MHGGVYVFPTEKTPPNPYLSHIKDRDLTTTDGRTLTLMNPAYSLRELMENFSGLYGQKGHITSLKLINPNNKADEWETNVLKNFNKNVFTEYHEIYNYNNQESIRYMKALKVKQNCLKCHAHQGYKVGDIRGGISITIPMKKYNEEAFLEKEFVLIYHTLFLFGGCVILFIIYKKITHSINNEILLENEVKTKEKLLNNQSKMVILGEMIKNIAHQWRQPLASLNGIYINMEMDFENNKLGKKEFDIYLQRMEDITQYMSNTINDFTNFFKIDKEKEKFNIKEIIEKAYSMLNPSLEENDIKFILDLNKDIILNSYPSEFMQIIFILVNNAKDAFFGKNIENKQIVITLYQKDDRIFLQLKDNAGGVNKEIIDKIFEPYFTTKHKYQGTGLGLFITKTIIERSFNGEVSVENDKDGAVFKINLEQTNG